MNNKNELKNAITKNSDIEIHKYRLQFTCNAFKIAIKLAFKVKSVLFVPKLCNDAIKKKYSTL
jgi:hypothetical protein